MGYMQCQFLTDSGEKKEVRVGIFKGQTDEWRQKVFDNKLEFLGEYITIEFKSYSKYGIPAQPRFKGFRWDL